MFPKTWKPNNYKLKWLNRFVHCFKGNPWDLQLSRIYLTSTNYFYQPNLSAHLFFREKPMKQGHCTGNFIRLKDKVKTTVKDKIKKFSWVLRESIVEAVKTRVYIPKDFNIINCVFVILRANIVMFVCLQEYHQNEIFFLSSRVTSKWNIFLPSRVTSTTLS